MLINSAQNAKFKWLKSLKQKKYRLREGAAIVEGRRTIEQVVALGYSIQCLVLEETVDCQIEAAQVFYLGRQLFEQLSDTVHSQGVLAVVNIGQSKPIDYGEPIVVLNGIQDPGNMGTILRTCEAFSYQNIIATKGCVDIYGDKVLRASLGAVFKLTIEHNISSAQVVNGLKQNDYDILVTALGDSQPIDTIKANSPYAIVFGNEGGGVADIWLNNATKRIKIDTSGAMQSLNVAASAAIILYHFSK